MRILLDTHIVLFASRGSLSPARMALLNEQENELFVSSISLWEISMLYELGRIRLPVPLGSYLRLLYSHERYQIVDLTPDMLEIRVSIASQIHKDPADQIIVASALAMNAQLMTDDSLISKIKLVEVI